MSKQMQSVVVIIALAVFGYFFTEFSWQLFMLFTLLLLIAINVDFSDISEVSAKGFALKRETKKAKELNEQMQKSLEEFKQANKSFLTYELAAVEKEGLLNMMTNPVYMIKFVESSRQLINQVGDSDGELNHLMSIVKMKTLESFCCDMEVRFPEIAKDAKQAVSTGISYSYGDNPTYDLRKAAIDFSELSALKKELSEDKQIQWQLEVDRLKKFYETHFV